jgi:hypothetical protein
MPNLIHNDMWTEPDEFIGRVPEWITHWGIYSTFVLILLLVTIGCFIPYQEKLTVEVISELRDSGKYKTVAYTSPYNYGRIHRDQTVIINLNEYPSNYFGSFVGRIIKKTSYQKGNNYEITIDCNFQRVLDNNEQQLKSLSGSGVIVLNEQPLIVHLFPILRTIILVCT